jgi:hypothetical protein
MLRSWQETARMGLLVVMVGCGPDDSGNEGSCLPGEFNCECNSGACLGGLVCESNICVQPTGDGDGDNPGDGDGDGDNPGDGDGDGAPGDGDGDGDNPGDGDGDGDDCDVGEMFCDGSCTNVMTDDSNCGSCGNVCDITDQFGGCTNGICDPALSECILADDPPKSCNEVCSESGKACVNQGCSGATYYWYGSLNTCDQFQGSANGNDCSNPLTWEATYLRCCCQQP